MLKLALAVSAVAMLAGCGSRPSEPDASSVIATLNPDGSTSLAPVKAPGPLNTTECDRPEVAPTYPEARIATCVTDRSGKRGSVIYESGAAPAKVVAWSKAQAMKRGLGVDFETETTVSASQAERTLLVVAMANGSGSRVTVNWGR